MIFVTIQLQKKRQEQRAHPYATFVDLAKAFDTVNRDGLCKIMHRTGVTVHIEETLSEALAVTYGVKQGCVLSPTLFSLMFSIMLMDAFRGGHTGIRIVYSTIGHFLDSLCIQILTRLSTTIVHNLPISDDCAPNTETEADMHRSVELFTAGCANFWLTINTDKTIVVLQPPPNAAHSASHVRVNSTELKTVDNLAHFGSTLSRCIKIEDVMAHRVFKSQPSLRPPEKLHMKSPRSPYEHQTDDVQSGHLDDFSE
nr:unnamed protein product [Spirometra erinaceieuropaei]